MRRIFVLVVLLAAALSAQQASTYFPADNGFKWHYQSIPLDTLNQPVDSLTTYQIDSLAGQVTYQGVLANYTLTKVGPNPGILWLPYIDTSYLNLSGTEAKQYFRITNIDTLAAIFHALGIDTIFGTFNLINTIKSFQKWYSMYKFASSVNTAYTIFTYDTMVTINSTSVPLRFLLKGKRLADKTLATQIGTFACKPFLFEFSVNYLVSLPPPLPSLVVPLFTEPDTSYIAPGNWQVRRVIPSTVFDLSTFGLPRLNMPGMQTDIIPPITYTPATACKDVSLSSGWNIIAVPVEASNMTATTLFPEANSQFYAYNNGYTSAATLTTGKGYWVRYPSSAVKHICGNKVTGNKITLSAGWNIVGVYDTSVTVSAITTTPANILTSSFYSYQNGYSTASVLQVGKGYWVRASQAGVINLPTTLKKK